ncbi:RnfABCDGE type electron transport complex subunit C, partial [Bacteroidales bacterium OttesenSCG-928-M11]|nr:RnfABCDGE type electron transport complex subunit C [Bacteroidales bacterium OttesenSCG-928-M11]
MLKTFKIGGIHPPESKLSAGKKTRESLLPQQVVIPLSQSLGSPAESIVSKGDIVKVGTLIAKSSGYISTNIHSSVSGKVAKIDTVYDASGYKRDAIYIDVVDDIWEDSIDRTTTLIRDCSLSSEEIISKVEKSGIVGMGGATFPTNVKLLSASEKADAIIINATECEPFLTDDHSLMLIKTEEILVGITILMKAIKVDKAFIGIENNKKDAIALFEKLSPLYKGIQVVPLKTKYPQGGEKQLIEAILKRRVPSGKLPADVGCLVQNVG